MHIKGQYKEVISSVNVVAGTFYVASFQKKDIQKVAHALLRIFLLRSTPHLFSYNEAFGQVTIVLDEDTLSSSSTFPREFLTVSHGWRALEVTLGDCGLTESGIISKLSSALAQYKISIHYLSTYNTDYILVPENQLTNAINCFTHNFNIEITADVDETTDDGVGMLTTPDLPGMQVYEDIDKKKLVLSPVSLCLASVDKDDVPLCMDAILHMIFFPRQSEEFHFLSFTETPSELSMIMDKRDIHEFPQISCMSRKLLVETYPWRAIKRVDKSSFGETENVNSVSTSLADANISLLYLSVSNTSIILVRENKIKEAVSTLRANGFEVSESSISA